MGVTRILVELDRKVVKLVDRQISRGIFKSRDQAIRAAVQESFTPELKLTSKDVLALVKKGRAEYRRGLTRRVSSLSEL